MPENNQASMNEGKAKKEKDEVQITVSLDCEQKLSDLVERLNGEFDIGRITRKHVAIYLLDQGILNFSEEDAQAVKHSILTDVMLLEHAYKPAKDTGLIPDVLKKFLWKSMNLTGSSKKLKKSTQAKYSNAILKEKEAA